MTESEEKLIHKFINKTLTESEWKSLLKWLEKPTNRKQFNTYVRADYYVHLSNQDGDDNSRYLKIVEAVQTPASKVRKLWNNPIGAVAASVIFLLGLTVLWYYLGEGSTSSIQVVKTTIEQGTDGATLTLDDGTEVSLKKGSDYQNQYLKSNGEELVYVTKEDQRKVAYNYITVKRGKQFAITLSDGTKVWLNSDSKIKYPISFVSGQTRSVELVYGEAYFDVRPAEELSGDHFTVLHKHQAITVLGTEFNIKAYSDEQQLFTTLVEGSVEVASGNLQSILKPNDQSVIDAIHGGIDIRQVDAQSETAWKRGLFMFKNKNLSEIATTLSRWYDMDIEIENKSLRDVEFKGTLSKNQPLEEILNLIKNTKYINNYEIKENKVVIR